MSLRRTPLRMIAAVLPLAIVVLLPVSALADGLPGLPDAGPVTDTVDDVAEEVTDTVDDAAETGHRHRG